MASGAQVSMCNRYGQTPLDKAKPHLRQLLEGQKQVISLAGNVFSFHFISNISLLYINIVTFFMNGFRKGRENGSKYDKNSL